MKKILSVGMAVLMLALCTVTAFAEERKISTHADQEMYEIVYPADTVIPWEAQSQELGSVTATKMLISPGKTVVITVTSENEFKMINSTDAANTIAYTLSGTDAIAFLPGEYGKSFPVSANVAESEWRQAVAGEFSDILTFTAECVEA